MMEVQRYLKAYGIDKLQEDLSIVVTDYPDRVVLNYNQIESPRFHPICDECRALILRKGTWEVMARSFDRFYNWGEGVPQNAKTISLEQRVAMDQFASLKYDDALKFRTFDITQSVAQEKLDGSIMTVYFDGEKWCASTRKMAFAEGQTNLGMTFSDIFWKVANKYQLKDLLDLANMRDFCLVFELTGPENRIVTPYDKTDITLIGGRYLGEEENELKRSCQFRELSNTELDNLADAWKLNRPKSYTIDSVESLFKLVNGMESMEEGVVLVIEDANGSHWRVKVKNAKYLAIAHLRNNGNISPKRILALVMDNDHYEYLKYFECDKPYFSFVEKELEKSVQHMENVYSRFMGIESQKDFALTIKENLHDSWQSGILFAARKKRIHIREAILSIEPKKLSQKLSLKDKMRKRFGICYDEDS